jgi:hypothetical protein
MCDAGSCDNQRSTLFYWQSGRKWLSPRFKNLFMCERDWLKPHYQPYRSKRFLAGGEGQQSFVESDVSIRFRLKMNLFVNLSSVVTG